ncbi:hypothetical protein [Mesorhizobium sp. KR2-14]|uniref:hypothetical protein n=1 Tax=Mesorhizobium sp. KR2-14 TaxID=3156610 RepID=UPI0032B4B530
MILQNRHVMAVFCAFLFATAARADDRIVLGGDTYASGQSVLLSEPSPRDLMAAAFSVDVTGKVEKDAHAMGFSVDVDAPVGQDLYASGFSVNIRQPIGEDLSASGYNVLVQKDATVGGNARLAAGTLVVDAPVTGSLLAAAGTLTVNGQIGGDARLAAGKLKFGPDAKIGGTLTYFAREPIEIAPSVIAPNKVHFEKWEMEGRMGPFHRAMHDNMPHLWPSFLGIFFGFLITLAFLFVVAAILLAAAPAGVERMRERTITRPFLSMCLGVLGLGTLIGLVPLSAMSLVGIPLIPVVLFAIVVCWIAGYLLGIYALSWRVATGLGNLEPTMAARLVVLAVGLIVAAALNFIPFFGWLINLLILFLGLGGIVIWLLEALAARRPVQQTPVEGTPPPPAEDKTV